LAYWRTPPSRHRDVNGIDRIADPAGLTPNDPLVLLHGLGSDHEGLTDVVAALGDADLVVPDLPGCGKSPPLTDVNSVLNYADAIEGVRVHLGAESIVLVGHSLGANVALAYAGRYPDRVRSLALLHPVTESSGVGTFVARAYYRVGSWLPESLARIWLLSRPAVFLADVVSLSTHDRARRRQILHRDYRAAAYVSPRVIGEAYRSLWTTPFRDLALRITAPTLLVTGTGDRLASVASLRALHDLIPRSSLRIIDRAGHLWPVEEPDAAADLIASIVARSADGGSHRDLADSGAG
jgi:pimeloyl-ACP methyl ester carboxylesterase